MSWLQKYKFPLLALLAIILFYFFTRLSNLTSQPIFADEAIYIRWAQVMKSEPTLRFLPLSDGKTPLYMWIMIPTFKLFSDPLFAGRFLSVISGLFTLLGLFALSVRVFNIRVALIAAILYVALPYTLFFDRMALVDSMLSAFTVWAIFFALILVKKARLDWSMILGYLLGGALLTKTPAFFSLLMLPTSLLAFDFQKRDQLVKLLIYILLSVLIAYGMYNILRLGPNFQLLSVRNADYVFTLSELKNRPLDPFIPHLGDVLSWFNNLVSIPIWIFMLIGLGFAILSKNRMALVVLVWALVPALIQIGILRTFTARYLLPSIAPLLIFAAFGIDSFLGFFKTKLIYISFIILLAFPLFNDYLIITNPADAFLPINERRGYLEDWTAGYNFDKVAQFLISQKQKGPVLVGTEGYFGTLPDGLQIYLDKSEIPVVGGGATVSSKLRDAAKNNTTYYVGNEARVGVNLPNTKLIMRFEKPKPLGNYPQDAIVVYQVFP